MDAKPHLEVHVEHQIGTLGINVQFEVAESWTVLFGPSGSGKSTVLRVLAGLTRPRLGYAVVGDETVFDTRRGVWVPAHLRPVRWAAQRPALFPRMTVAENLAFGAQTGTRKSSLVQEALKRFHLTVLAEKRPTELSGGERQRVAVVRAAIGARERLLLLDEPFSGLDAGVREQLTEDLRGWLEGAPVLSVTHDVEEAFLLSAEVVRVAEGRVIAQGPAATVLADERLRVRTALG